MAFSVSYIYEITDRYTAPLRKITRATNAYTKAAERAKKKLCELGKGIDLTGLQATKFNRTVGSGGTTGHLRKLSAATDQIEKRLRKVANSARAATDQINRANHQVNNVIERAPRTANGLARMGRGFRSASFMITDFNSVAGSLGAGLVLTNLFSTAIGFEQALNKVRAVTGATTQDIAKLSAQAKTLGRTTEFSAVQAAQAMSFLGMSGLNTQQILSTMPGMLDLAAAGGLELSSAADIATNILQAFQLPLTDIGHLSNILAKSAASANTSVFQMAGAMKNVAPSAKLAGLGVEETAAAMMVMANAGIQGQEAGTFLMNAIRALSAMTPKAAKTLAKLGIDPRKLKNSKGEIKDFTGLIDQLAARGAKAEDLFRIFDIQGAKAMSVLMQTGAPKLKEFTKLVTSSEGSAKKMAKTLMEGAPGAIKRFQSALEGVKLFMAGTLLPALESVLTKFTSFLTNLEKNSPGLLKFGTHVLVAVAALTALMLPVGLITGAFGALMTVVGAITVPIAMIAGGVLFLAGALRHWIATGHPVIEAFQRLGEVIAPVIPIIKFTGKAILDLIGITGTAEGQISLLSIAFDALGQVAMPIISTITAALRVMIGSITTVAKVLTGDFSGAWETVKSTTSGVLTDFGKMFSAAEPFPFRTDAQKLGQGAANTAAASQVATADVNARGTIVVEATAGTKVKESMINLNEGSNLAVTY